MSSSNSKKPSNPFAASEAPPSADGEISIEDEIRNKIKAVSKGYRPKQATGMAALFDMSLFPEDYTANGQVVGRMVNKDPGRLAIMKAKGYHFPQELSDRLPNRDLGNCTLMLQPRDLAVASKLSRRAKIDAMDGQASPEYSPDYQQFKSHIDNRHTGHQRESISFEVDPKTKAVVTAD